MGALVNGDGLPTGWQGHIAFQDKEGNELEAVSYTHLTLPTNREV